MKFLIERIGKHFAINAYGDSIFLKMLPDAKVGQLWDVQTKKEGATTKITGAKLISEGDGKKDMGVPIVPYTEFVSLFKIDKMNDQWSYNAYGDRLPLAMLHNAKVGQLWDIATEKDGRNYKVTGAILISEGDKEGSMPKAIDSYTNPPQTVPFKEYQNHSARANDQLSAALNDPRRPNGLPAEIREELWSFLTKEERRSYDMAEPNSLERNEIFIRAARREIHHKHAKVRDLWMTFGSSALNADNPRVIISIETWGEGWAYDVKDKYTEEILTAGKCHNFNSVTSEVVDCLVKLWQEAENE